MHAVGFHTFMMVLNCLSVQCVSLYICGWESLVFTPTSPVPPQLPPVSFSLQCALCSCSWILIVECFFNLHITSTPFESMRLGEQVHSSSVKHVRGHVEIWSRAHFCSLSLMWQKGSCLRHWFKSSLMALIGIAMANLILDLCLWAACSQSVWPLTSNLFDSAPPSLRTFYWPVSWRGRRSSWLTLGWLSRYRGTSRHGLVSIHPSIFQLEIADWSSKQSVMINNIKSAI